MIIIQHLKFLAITCLFMSFSLTSIQAQTKDETLNWLKLKQQEWQVKIKSLKGTGGSCFYADGGGSLHFTDSAITAECDSAEKGYQISIDWSIITKVTVGVVEGIQIYCKESKMLILGAPHGIMDYTNYDEMIKKLRELAELNGAKLEE